MEPLGNLSLAQVIQNCEEQTSNFLRKRISDTKFCFELFRRAFAEQNYDAVNAIYEIYRILLEKWANQHPLLPQTNETAEYFGLTAYRSFQFAIRPEKIGRFVDLRQILAYLSACVDTSIKQYVRRFPQDELMQPEQDFGYTPDFEETIQAQKLWEYICKLLDDEQSILLARCMYVYDMKPQEIVEQYEHIWPDTETVRVHGQRIRRKLHGSSGLRGWGRH